jgi:hypothetical protein
MRHRSCQAGIVLLGCTLLCGCAHEYIDADGNRVIVGLVHLTLPGTAPASTAADWMRVRTVGLALSRNAIGGALELGYSDNTLAAIHNNSCVQLDRLPPSLLLTKGVDHDEAHLAGR